MHYLFIGDSITDAGRRPYFGNHLGQGYVTMIAGALMMKEGRALTIKNQGIGGDRLADLRARWQKHALDQNYDLVSISIGINDLWHRKSQGLDFPPAVLDQFEEVYRSLIKDLLEVNPDVRLVLMGLYVLPYPEEHKTWFSTLQTLNQIIKSLAVEFQASYVDVQKEIEEALKTGRPEDIVVEDGIHPTDYGQTLIAQAWLKEVAELEILS